MDTPTPTQNTNKKLILVAEDDIYYANIYKIKLAKEGYDVAVVGNGDWALKFVKERTPNLILLDLVMPIKDGFETLKELKKMETLKKTKIIVLSSLGQDEDIKRAHDLGADGYIIKTNISIGELMEKIKSYLSH